MIKVRYKSKEELVRHQKFIECQIDNLQAIVTRIIESNQRRMRPLLPAAKYKAERQALNSTKRALLKPLYELIDKHQANLSVIESYLKTAQTISKAKSKKNFKPAKKVKRSQPLPPPSSDKSQVTKSQPLNSSSKDGQLTLF